MRFDICVVLFSSDPFRCPILLLVSGLSMIAAGLLHRFPSFAQWDARAFLVVHAILHRTTPVFRLLWNFGRTWFALILLAVTFLEGWKTGVLTVLAYSSAAGIERVIKLKWKRPRPFERLHAAQMRQSRRPVDPSHPSGDALRACFFALILPAVFGFPLLPASAIYILAMLVSLGRIALGVHYPLDVLGGIGLGAAAAGAALISYQLFGAG